MSYVSVPQGTCTQSIFGYAANCTGTSVVATQCSGSTTITVQANTCTASLSTLFSLPGAKVACYSGAAAVTAYTTLFASAAAVVAMLASFL